MPCFYLKETDAVFIHNPKTGGRTIRETIWPDKTGPFQGYIPAEYRDKFKFTFVRNPYDRFISAWKYCISQTRYKTSLLDDPELFFSIVAKNSNHYFWDCTIYDNFKGCKTSFAVHHASPQSDPFYMICETDFVGRFENFQEDFNTVCDMLSIKRVELRHPKKYKTDHLHYSEYFKDKEFTERVTEFYKEDFEKFGYDTLI
jgi:hypothetical protein